MLRERVERLERELEGGTVESDEEGRLRSGFIGGIGIFCRVFYNEHVPGKAASIFVRLPLFRTSGAFS